MRVFTAGVLAGGDVVRSNQIQAACRTAAAGNRSGQTLWRHVTQSLRVLSSGEALLERAAVVFAHDWPKL